MARAERMAASIGGNIHTSSMTTTSMELIAAERAAAEAAAALEEAERLRITNEATNTSFRVDAHRTSISMAAAEEAVRLQREEEAKAMFAMELARKEAALNSQVASQRSVFEATIRRIRTGAMTAIRSDVSTSEQAAAAASAAAASAADEAKASAELVFNNVVTEARSKLAQLRTSAESSRRAWEVKVQVVARARSAAETAKANALRM